MIQHHLDHPSAYQRHSQKTPTTHHQQPQLHNLLQHASASNHYHHHRTSKQTGTHGTATLIAAWLNSKGTLDSVPTGLLLLAEWVSPSSNAKPDGKNSKTCNIYKTSNSPPGHYKSNHHDKYLPSHQHPPHQHFPHHHIHNRIFPLLPRQHHRLHHIDHLQLLCCCRRLLSERLVRTVIRRNLHTRLLAVISYDLFHPAFSPACRRTNPLTCSDKLFSGPSAFATLFGTFGFSFPQAHSSTTCHHVSRSLLTELFFSITARRLCEMMPSNDLRTTLPPHSATTTIS